MCQVQSDIIGEGRKDKNSAGETSFVFKRAAEKEEESSESSESSSAEVQLMAIKGKLSFVNFENAIKKLEKLSTIEGRGRIYGGHNTTKVVSSRRLSWLLTRETRRDRLNHALNYDKS